MTFVVPVRLCAISVLSLVIHNALWLPAPHQLFPTLVPTLDLSVVCTGGYRQELHLDENSILMFTSWGTLATYLT